MIEKLFKNNIPVFVAPMAGITDAPFRDLVYNFGVSAVVSEMISSEALIRNSKKTFKRLKNFSDKCLTISQIVGADPDHMAESAVINESFGVDAIDINMGCPARKIVNNESGSALMKNEDLAVRIAESVVNSVKIPVTLKMRLGWDNDNLNCYRLAKRFEDVGIEMLSIHCRTRAQMYTGVANWGFLKDLREVIKIPFLCNGDIKSIDDAQEALRLSNAHGVMIGRGSLGHPWFLNQVLSYLNNMNVVKSPTIEEQFEIIMAHFENVLDFYGELQGIKIFRKHFCWYSSCLKCASCFREQINRMDDKQLIIDHVKKFYDNVSGTLI